MLTSRHYDLTSGHETGSNSHAKRTLVATILAILLGTNALQAVPPGYDWHDYNGHWYALTDVAGTWEDAQNEAASIGANLVTVNDIEENAWLVVAFALQPTDYGYWIGLYQPPGSPEPAGGWCWISGEPVTFTAWYSGEPDNRPPSEDYALIQWFGAGGWIDVGPQMIPSHAPLQGIMELPGTVEATVDIAPDVLNLQSNGRWITCYVTLPQSYDVTNIDSQSVLVEDAIVPTWSDVDEAEQVLRLKISRTTLIQYLQDHGILESGEIDILISGLTNDGILFEGVGSLRILDPGD